jgi:hypothetical protein
MALICDLVAVFISAILHWFLNIRTENQKHLSPVMLVAMRILPQVAEEVGSTRLFPRKGHEECQALRCLVRSGAFLLKLD